MPTSLKTKENKGAYRRLMYIKMHLAEMKQERSRLLAERQQLLAKTANPAGEKRK